MKYDFFNFKKIIPQTALIKIQKNKLGLSISFGAVLLTCFTYGAFNNLKLSGTNFGQEVPLSHAFSFVFNKELVDVSLLNQEEDFNYITFVPAIEGKYVWTNFSELTFRPSKPLKPDTEYKAIIGAGIMRHCKEQFDYTPDSITFHTPGLTLTKILSYWGKSSIPGKTMMPKLRLMFNYPIQTADLISKLKITSDGKAVPFNIPKGETSDQVIVELTEIDSLNSDMPLKLKGSSGVILGDIGKKSRRPFEGISTLKPQTYFGVIEIENKFNKDGEGVVTLYTSHEIDQASVAGSFEINPPIPVKTEMLDNGFRLTGAFDAHHDYVIVVKQTLKNIFGATLSQTFVQEINFKEKESALEFVHKKGIYLSSKGAKNVALRMYNPGTISLSISKIYENNLVHYISSGGQYYDDYDYHNSPSEMYSDVILEKENLRILDFAKVEDEVYTMNLNFPQVDNKKGIYFVSLSGENTGRASKLVSISDLGIIAKSDAEKEDLMVFVNTLSNADALGDVEVNLISKSNQVLATGKTDNNGICMFKGFSKVRNARKLAIITVKSGNDFNYMDFQSTEVNTSRFPVEGHNSMGNKSGNVFLYSERDLYRPGEKAHFNTVVRNEQFMPMVSMPYRVFINAPNGNTVKESVLNTDAQGAFEFDHLFPVSSMTGSYSIMIKSLDDVYLASMNVNIEEFMPDRIKVEVKTDKENYREKEKLLVSTSVLNLFGPPAANRNYEMELVLNPKVFSSPKFPEYDFNIPRQAHFNGDIKQGKTDANGAGAQEFLLAESLKNTGQLEAKIFVTAFDEMGRPVNSVKKANVFTQDLFYGFKRDDYGYIDVYRKHEIEMAAVNQDGKPSSHTAQFQVYEMEYVTNLERNREYMGYSSRKKEKLIYSGNIQFVNGKSNYTFIPKHSGEYIFKLNHVATGVSKSMGLFAYGWGYTSNTDFEVSTEGTVTMQFDKESYEVGETAKVLLKTPFDGKILVTLERDKIYDQRYLRTRNKSAEFEFVVQKEHIPNVYVAATLFKPFSDDQTPLTVAHGYLSATVSLKGTHLVPEIIAKASARSKTKQHIAVKTGSANAHVTIAVVDEGILQIKNYKMPKIFEFFYRKRALQILSYDLYSYLLPEISPMLRYSTGGDEAGANGRFVNPIANNRVKLATFWSGTIKTGADGIAHFDIDIPQFSGSLRIMATAFNKNAFGTAVQNMQVMDPIVISSGVPKFLSPNDQAIVPVNIINTTDKNMQVNVTIKAEGAVSLQNLSPLSITVEANKEYRTEIALNAANKIGIGKLSVTVKTPTETFEEKTELTVRPPASSTTSYYAGRVFVGKSEQINMSNDYIAGTGSSHMMVGNSPLIEFGRQLDYLLEYPHGCIEQTVSKAFPQIYFTDLVKSMPSAFKVDQKPATNVQNAIFKIEAQQGYNGAIQVWPSYEYEDWWASVYACHFLLEAQKAGYTVNSKILDALINYLVIKSAHTPTVESVKVTAMSYQTSQVTRTEMVYTLYVLGLAGKAQLTVMNFFKSKPNLLSCEDKYLLACTYKIAGDHSSFASLLPVKYQSNVKSRHDYGDYASPIRNIALVLNTLVEADPNNPQVNNLATMLSQHLKVERYTTTQEAAFSFLAMGKIAKRANALGGSALIKSKEALLATYQGTPIEVAETGGKTIDIYNKGNSEVFYFARQQGISASGNVAYEDNVIRARREYFDRNGKLLSPENLKQNDLVVVKLNIVAKVQVNNVVMSDVLPACFEIENPRLNDNRELHWAVSNIVPNYLDIRDDRLNLYLSAGPTLTSYYYLVRVVNKGNFTQGLLSAESMYIPEFHSFSGKGAVKVN